VRWLAASPSVVVDRVGGSLEEFYEEGGCAARPLATTMEVGEEVVRALGAGFDLTSDFRLRFAKAAARRLVDLDEDACRDVPLPVGGGATLRGVPRDVVVDKGDRIRFRSDVLEFNQVSSIHSCFDPARSQAG
jgi:hypothetical protein